MPTTLMALLCPNCGAPVRNGDTQCDYCGSTIYLSSAAEIVLPALTDAPQVIAKMRERIAANATDAAAYYQLGLACFTQRLYDQAERAFRQADVYGPGNASAHYFIGLTILKQNENDILSLREFFLNQILHEFETAATLNPSLPQAQPYLALAQGLLERNRANYAKAIPLLKQAIAGLPKLAAAYKVLATCAFQTGDYSGAIDAANKSWELVPNDEDIAFLLGATYSHLREQDQTQAWARRLAKLRGNADAWHAVIEEFHGHFG